MSGQRPRRLSIACAPRDIFSEAADILLTVADAQGVDARRARDGDTCVLDDDVLLILGRGTEMKGFERLLTSRERRPTTLLWQLEALPPPSVGPWANQLGAALQQPSWRDLGLPGTKLLDRFMPLKGELARLARAVLARKYRRSLRQSGEHYIRLDKNDLRFVSAQAQWIMSHARSHGGWVDHVVCSTQPRTEYLARHGVAADFVPVGYHTRWGELSGEQNRDIDVIFLGFRRSRGRRHILKRLFQDLASRHHRMAIVDSGMHGDDRQALLNRARVLVNLPTVPWDFAGIRLLSAIGCGALVVSTTCDDTAPFKAGRHFVAAEAGRMVEVIEHFLACESERRRFADRALDALLEDATMESSLRAILRIAGQPIRDIANGSKLRSHNLGAIAQDMS